ncbi:hypothetical protein UFOVP212_36 [uncultured Caudovirales phage]|uniref:Uncharacterized protein n=1 Tax=uncultured Caudovirales phage TaxID=2100421 RepID=A0A6J7WKY5_9CAUD|nr:hypothetical protein UFOVP212_36 [uncultured Caudovirales phage]
MIKKLIKANESFAIMQYFEYFRCVPSEVKKKYEILFIAYDSNGNPFLNYEKLKGEDLKYFFRNIHLFEKKVNDKSGVIYEINEFKNNYNFIINKSKPLTPLTL